MGIFSKNPRISFPVNMSPKVIDISTDRNDNHCRGFRFVHTGIRIIS